MTRLQTIEKGLAAINEAAFQELCDSILISENKDFTTFSRYGSVSGKQKTKKGTPDTFFQRPDGKFIFVEYSTDITKKVKKLEDDINKCLDPKRTKVNVSDICNIIFFINFNISPAESNKLNELLSDTHIKLRLYTIDELSLKLYLDYRELAHTYLGIPLDTGQIVTIETFIKEYDKASGGIATPLDTVFFHRENEIKELIEAIHGKDFIILSGAPGVGKTKLALEGIKQFLSNNLTYSAFCISYKNCQLSEDLWQVLNIENDYILFVDDANRIDAFGQILGFYSVQRKGNLKIVITIRDYALPELQLLCSNYYPSYLKIDKLSDEQIKDIIKAEPFVILNGHYQKEILRIADGNPRLAIMTTLLAKKEENIHSLSDVSELFELYFNTYLKDSTELKNPISLKSLGLIAFFNAIQYEDKNTTSSILIKFNIEYSYFIDCIERLERLELVEMRYGNVKVAEQNLASFFFYKAFVKEDLLLFRNLLENYFDNYAYRFKDTVISANNTFGSNKVMDKLFPDLKSYLTIILGNKERIFRFLDVFWFYLPAETLDILLQEINQLPEQKIECFIEIESSNIYDKEDEILKLLYYFFRYPNYLKDSLILLFEYCRRKPEKYSKIVEKIKEDLVFEWEDEYRQWVRQKTLFDLLNAGIKKKDRLSEILFFELAVFFLGYTFHIVRGSSRNTLEIGEYNLSNKSYIQTFRKSIWEIIDINYKNSPKEYFSILKGHIKNHSQDNRELALFDAYHILTIAENHLDNNYFPHCKYVQYQIREWTRIGINCLVFSYYCNKYTNNLYTLYRKVLWSFLDDKEDWEFDNWNDYMELKINDLKSNFIFTNKEAAIRFVKDYFRIYQEVKEDFKLHQSLDIIINENYLSNFDIGHSLLTEIIKNNNEIAYIPISIFGKLLQNTVQSNKVWKLISQNDFNLRPSWEMSFFYCLDEKCIKKEDIPRLLNTFKIYKNNTYIQFECLKKYLLLDSELFEKFITIIFNRNEVEKARLLIPEEVFKFYFNYLGVDYSLIRKAYLQQLDLNSYYDYKGEAFNVIYIHDEKLLDDYIIKYYLDINRSSYEHRRKFGFVWNSKNIEKVLSGYFDAVSQEKIYFDIFEDRFNELFIDLEVSSKERVKKFLFSYTEKNIKNLNRINLIVNIIRNCMREYYEEYLYFFLNLNQDVDFFSKIWWRGRGTSIVGDGIFGDIEAADWREIYNIVNKFDLGIKILSIKRYILDEINYCQIRGDRERKEKFLNPYY